VILLGLQGNDLYLSNLAAFFYPFISVPLIYRPSCDPGAATVFAAVFKSPQGEKIDVLLSQMQHPLLLLWGEGDPWMNARERGAKFRQHYPALQECYLQAGHCPHDEVPEQVNSLLKDWVLSLDTRRSDAG
jgi:pimeloyl-ACP methyl ester carboxylesterase